jgi:hypothetical protein
VARVTQVDADARVNLLIGFLLGIVGTELSLETLRALHGMNDRGKVDQEGIAAGLDDGAMMFSDRLLNDAIMDMQQPQHAGFVGTHLAAKAYHVGEHDGCQLAGLGLYCLVHIRAHADDYAACLIPLSNRTGGRGQCLPDFIRVSCAVRTSAALPASFRAHGARY